MKMEKIYKIKDFILKDKFLLALLGLDLISFIFGIFIYAIGTLFFFLIFITTTYLLVLFEKHNTKIFIIGIALLIFSFVGGIYPHSIIAFSVLLITFVLFVLPQSFLLLILKHFAIFDRQNAIVKALIIDAIILIPFFMFFGFAIPSL